MRSGKPSTFPPHSSSCRKRGDSSPASHESRGVSRRYVAGGVVKRTSQNQHTRHRSIEKIESLVSDMSALGISSEGGWKVVEEDDFFADTEMSDEE